jgi:hypothetical protein
MAQAISLQITEAGRRALLEFLRQCEPDSIVAVGWSQAKGECNVGAYKRERIPSAEVVSISGISFVFDQTESPDLDGRTLDYRDGEFCVL